MSNTIGFAAADDARQELDELVACFGRGNRTAYLRATSNIVRTVRIAEELRAGQSSGQTKPTESGHALDDMTRLVRESRS